MIKIFLLVIIALPFFFNVSAVCPKDKVKGEIIIKSKGQGTWEMYDEEDVLLGRIEKDRKELMLYDKHGAFVGRIYPSGRLRPRTARSQNTTILPEDGRAYVNALEVLDKIK